MPEKKYRTDDLKDMLRDVVNSDTFYNAIEGKRLTIIEFLAIVASEMKKHEKNYQ